MAMSSTVDTVAIGERDSRYSFELCMERCGDDAGSYGVESHMLFRVLHCQASHGGVHATFRDHRKGSGFASNWIIYQRGADAHDAAPAFLRLNLPNRELRDV